jgi:LuxR family maltose regulon positive regulatory protein
VDGILQQILLRGYVYMDNLSAARDVYELSLAPPTDPEPLEQVVLAGAFSQVELEAGELNSARVHAEAATAEATRLGGEGHFGSSEALRTLAALAYEQDHLDEAERLLERCVEIVGTGRPPFLLLTVLELSRVWNARGDREAALAELDRARAALPSDARSPLIGRVYAYRARLLAEDGKIAAAREAATQLPAGRRRSVVEARCDLADMNGRGARSRLERLASRSATPREALEYALLDARAGLEEPDAAQRPKLQRVLDLGRAAGFIRTLADEGHDLAAALAHELRHQPTDAYSDALAPVLEHAIAAAPARHVPLFAGVMLSERELTVLTHLATRLTTREIAAELYVSMNTFRTHTKSIYRKLGVDSRGTAVEAARTLGIL